MARSQKTNSAPGLNTTERSFIDALRRGVPWDQNFRDQFQSEHRASDAQTTSETSGQDKGGAPTQEPAIDGGLLRALIVVEGAAARGIAPPVREAERCRKADIDPTIQLNVRGIGIESAEDGRPIVIRCSQFVDNTPVLDLRGVCFPKRLALQGCVFEGPEGELANLLLDDAQIGTIDLSRARFQDLSGDQLCLTGDFRGVSMKARSIDLADAMIGGNLNCAGSELARRDGIALQCNGARVDKNVQLSGDFQTEGEVNLVTARIGGQFSCTDGQFKAGKTGRALHCGGAKIDQSIFLRGRFKAEGEVNFAGARIGGQLSCNGGQFTAGKTGGALQCNSAQIDESVFLRNGFKAEGEVNFTGARIGGLLDCTGGQFTAGETGGTLHCNDAQIDESVILRNGFKAEGEVNFAGARIGGSLACIGGQFTAGKTGRALHCNSAKIDQSIFLRGRFKAEGEVNFAGARIGGQLSCNGGQFTAGKTGGALHCNSAQIDESVFLRDGFKAEGEVNFVGARIGGLLDCTGGQFTAGKTGGAFECNGAQIGQSVFLSDGFKAEGEVNLTHVRIGQSLDLSRCAIAVPGKSVDDDWEAKPCVLDLDSVYIADQLFLPRTDPERDDALIRGSIDLQNAHCRILHDSELPKTAHAPRQWASGWVKLDGLTYDRLGVDAPKLARHRKRWLNRQPKADRHGKLFKPQPYEQLSKILREMGHTSSARSIAVAKQWRMHHSGNLHLSAYVFRWFALWPSGYGYRPQYPFILAIALVLLGNVVFETAYRTGYMSPAQPHAAIVKISDSVRAIGRDANAETSASPPACSLVERAEVVPPFNGIVYTLDTFIPLVDLDQESSWKPSQTRRCTEGLDGVNPGPLWWRQNWLPGWATDAMERWMPGWFVFAWKWGLMVAGFLITALIAASLSGLIRKD